MQRNNDRPFTGLITIFTIAWLLVLLGVIVIFEFIVPFKYCSCFYDSVAKAAFTAILAVVWLLAMVTMRNVFVKRRILLRKSELA